MSVVRSEYPGFTWIALVDPDDDEVRGVEQETGLTALGPERAATIGHGPRFDPDVTAHRTVLKAMDWADEARSAIAVAKVKVVVADGVVVTTQTGATPDVEALQRRLDDDPPTGGHAVVVLAVVAEAVIAGYEPLLDDVGNQVEAAEADVFSEGRTPGAAQTLYALKKVVLDMRRVVTPVANVLEEMSAPGTDAVPDTVRPRVRHLADRARHAAAEIQAESELLSDALNANLAQQGVQQNVDMRTISAWAAVAAVPTLLAGIWGMNFRHMPELDWYLGYPLSLGVIVGASAALAWYLRSKRWI